MIILEAEDMWESSMIATSLITHEIDLETYKRERDNFKARYIYDVYGYEYFRRFIDRCPHVIDMFDDLVPCNSENCNCTMFCHKYDFERGCTNYAND